jgi:hypothetical protein
LTFDLENLILDLGISPGIFDLEHLTFDLGHLIFELVHLTLDI